VRLGNQLGRIFLSLSFFVFLAILWEITARGLKIPTPILPPISGVLHYLIHFLPTMLSDVFITLYRALLGLGLGTILGLFLGFVLGYSSYFYKSFYPLLIAFYSIPKQALVPLIVLWTTFGTTPAIVTALITSFFPILVNTTTGILILDPDLVALAKIYGATKWRLFVKISIPYSMPYFFAALRVAGVGAIVGATLSEMIAAQNGVGHKVLMASVKFQTLELFSYVLLIGIVSVFLYWLLTVCDRYIVWWAYRGQERL